MKKMFKIFSFVLFFVVLIFSSGEALAYPSVYPKGLTVDEPSETYDGYTTFSIVNLETKSDTMYMVDMEGNVVHKWEDIGSTLHNVLLDNGHIVTSMLQPRGEGRVQGALKGIVERDWNNNIVWSYENEYLHHPFKVLPNGNILAIFWTELPKELHSQVKRGIPGSEAENNTIYTDIVRIINRNGDTLWEWIPYKQLNISDYLLGQNDNRNHWPNVNVVTYLPKDNSFNGKESVLISLRRTNTLIIVNMETKKVVWEWGKDQISHQHDPQLLDNGNILLFDNGYRADSRYGQERKFSRIIEVNPRIKKIVWEYDGSRPGSFAGLPLFSPVGGFVQRLPNGNTLMVETNVGRIFEVTYDKKIVWEYITDRDTDAVFRKIQSEVNWPEKLPPPRPTGEKLGGRKIIDGREIIEGTKPLYQAICILGWVVAFLGVALVIKIIHSRRKNE